MIQNYIVENKGEESELLSSQKKMNNKPRVNTIPEEQSSQAEEDSFNLLNASQKEKLFTPVLQQNGRNSRRSAGNSSERSGAKQETQKT